MTQVSTAEGQSWLKEIEQDMNPANDGWDSELIAEQANKQLKRLGELLIADRAARADEVSPLLAADFACTELRPAQRHKVFEDAAIVVERDARQTQASLTKQTPDGFAAELTKLSAGLQDAADRYFKFKLFRLVPLNDGVSESFETTSYFELAGQPADGAIHRTATWTCRWQNSSDDKYPRLASIAVDAYEEVAVSSTNGTLFSDCTESVFRSADVFEKQFRYGIDHWRAGIENYFGMYFDGLRGVAVGDANGDGLDDIYLCEPGGLPNRLLVQSPNGLLLDVANDSGVDLLDSTRCALFVDLDNDGDQDLVMPAQWQLQFYANDGEGRYVPKLLLPLEGQTAFSLAAADYDQDGDVDVYACFYHGHGGEEDDRRPAPIPYHDARTGGFNRLIQNEGNWKFRDVTTDVGLDDNNDRWSFAATWEDYDNDGDLDLYVANDFGRNNLYRQQNGQFADVAGPSGAEDMNFGMSVAFGDYDRDGWMDIHVSNMFSAAGGRITFQHGFQPDSTQDIRTAYQQMVDGNSLLRNKGDGTFRDVTAAAHVGVGRWAWGSLFADINNDGWEDLLVANGFMTGTLPGDL